MSLTDLIRSRKYNTDKQVDELYGHSYIVGFYDKEFQDFKPKSILEIGVKHGGSLLLWADYFKESMVTGIDISSDDLDLEVFSRPNIDFINTDAYSKQVVDALGSFDLVIDDGPHTIQSQIDCINLYLPIVNSGGLLVIEDIQDELYIETLASNVPAEFRDGVRIVDLRAINHRFDDLMFTVKK